MCRPKQGLTGGHMLDMITITITVLGDASRTLQAYADSTQRTLEQVAIEGLADWAETVAEPRLEGVAQPVGMGIHLVTN